PDDLAGLRVAATLAHAGRVLAVDEAVLPDAADRDLDDLLAVLTDDRLFGDDVGDVLADRLADLQSVPRTIAGAAITAFRIRGIVGAEDRFERPHGRGRCPISPSTGCWPRT